MNEFQTRRNRDAAGIDRRSFLKLAGFSFAGAALIGCEQGRVEKAIPYLVKPEEVTPGKANWYASTCAGCPAGCGILVKTREGRPIKVEGNPDHPVSRGGLCAVGQAMVLGLYDSRRLNGPLFRGVETSWEAVDRAMGSALGEIVASGGAVRILTGNITSPTTRSLISQFLGRFRGARHIIYDPLSCSAILDAHAETHGRRILPVYRFDRAEVIVSFDADFLGTWISPVEYTAGYRAGRTLAGSPPKCSRHIQFESRYSLTGANADLRYAVSVPELSQILYSCAVEVEKLAGRARLQAPEGVPHPAAPEIARGLWESRQRSLVVCGVNRTADQVLVNYLNHLLGNYGTTIDTDRPSLQRQENDRDMAELVNEMHTGSVAALFVAGANPVYDHPLGKDFALSLRRIPLVVSFAHHPDETAEHAHYVCPVPHPLESWSDAEPVAGTVSMTQPSIAPMGRTRSLNESLAAWNGNPAGAREILEARWHGMAAARHAGGADPGALWDRAIHDGFMEMSAPAPASRPFSFEALRSIPFPSQDTGLTLVLYPTVAMLSGAHAHNAWLQELPDPVTKVVWDNYASLAPETAAAHGVSQGDIVRLAAGGRSVELPVLLQPGQHPAVIAVPLGYGRKGTDRFTTIGPRWLEAKSSVGPGGLVGSNAAPLLGLADGMQQYAGMPVHIERTDRRGDLACTQTYSSLADPQMAGGHAAGERPIIQHTTLGEYAQNPSSGANPRHPSHSMWPEQHSYHGHHWGMVIDLNACTGCSACIIGCQAENNIPVVGKDEVSRNREMHWIRIDRYYADRDGSLQSAHQPMMCHHCDNAPCETVCPVLATVHSSEGLNQQVYNRCVGTRYCANNCPYKIRRFNWFDYPQDDTLQNLVLNPDVTVRSRGVMEKCSFCIQRIQEAKIEAKRGGKPVRDGDVVTACQQSCPAQAIVFGDMNDPASRVTAMKKDPRCFHVLAELETRPSVGYMTMVRNCTEHPGDETHG